jgi:acetylornithine deacetylase/succinyl-diaminopimelate desuccinylase-like protein
MRRAFAVLPLVALCACASAQTPPKSAEPAEAQALNILKTAVAIPTVQGQGNVPKLATYITGVLVEAGYAPADIRFTPMSETGYLVARYPGTDRSKKPIVIIGHMDVVAAKREDWQRDPFTPVIENGYLFGRGASDNKGDVSMVVATLAKLKRAGWKPGRDLILGLSGDEETEQFTAAKMAEELKNAELVLNDDAGGGRLDEAGKPTGYGIQVAEKTYADFSLTVTDPGGHSSLPTKTNAIYRLSNALQKLSAYAFPVMRSEVVVAMFKAVGPIQGGPVGEAMVRYAANPNDAAAVELLSNEPSTVGQLRTTCVATQISGGHAPNALPQRASANVNCRIFPGVPVEEIRGQLAKVINDPTVVIARTDTGAAAGASPLRADVLAAITKGARERYPGIVVIPNMSAGATDSIFFRALGVPAYGVSASFSKDGDTFAHGLNERFPVANIGPGLKQWEAVIKELAK